MKKKKVFTKEVILLVGCPGSGKSTYVENVLRQSKSDFVICSSDNVLMELAATEGLTYDQAYARFSRKEVEKAFKETIWKAIEEGRNVVIDRTNLSVKGRAKMLSYFDMWGGGEYKKTCVLFNFKDLDVIRGRLEKRRQETGKSISERVLQEMLAQYQEPSKSEFTEIIYLN